MVRNQRDEPTNATDFDSTSFVEDYTYDCDTATTVGDALATYLRDKIARGELTGSSTA